MQLCMYAKGGGNAIVVRVGREENVHYRVCANWGSWCAS